MWAVPNRWKENSMKIWSFSGNFRKMNCHKLLTHQFSFSGVLCWTTEITDPGCLETLSQVYLSPKCPIPNLLWRSIFAANEVTVSNCIITPTNDNCRIFLTTSALGKYIIFIYLRLCKVSVRSLLGLIVVSARSRCYNVAIINCLCSFIVLGTGRFSWLIQYGRRQLWGVHK